MIVVADSTPLIAIARINQFQILRSLYDFVAIPRAVETEVTTLGASRAGAAEVRSADWIGVYDVSDRAVVDSFGQQLDLGESEAIALAIQLEPSTLLIDEAKGRRIARAQNIRTIGTIGTLLLAKRQGLIDEISPCLSALRDADFRMSDRLYQEAMGLAGESL